ncbi:MAG: DinB family protein [Burkholderiaceae bacterium]
MGWQLASYHLDTLTTGECLWRPARRGLHVHQDLDGAWTADWPEHEGYDLGPSSIAWMTWHFGFWWSMALDHNFGGGTLAREDVKWPGSAEAAREWIRSLHGKWAALLAGMTEEELASTEKVRWPFEGLPLADLFAWANTELVKSASEIGYARFLFAARQGE